MKYIEVGRFLERGGFLGHSNNFKINFYKTRNRFIVAFCHLDVLNRVSIWYAPPQRFFPKLPFLAVLAALADIIDAAHGQNKSVSICGELAGDPRAAPLLVAMGFDQAAVEELDAQDAEQYDHVELSEQRRGYTLDTDDDTSRDRSQNQFMLTEAYYWADLDQIGVAFHGIGFVGNVESKHYMLAAALFMSADHFHDSGNALMQRRVGRVSADFIVLDEIYSGIAQGSHQLYHVVSTQAHAGFDDGANHGVADTAGPGAGAVDTNSRHLELAAIGSRQLQRFQPQARYLAQIKQVACNACSQCG